ncbi:MAG: response regulator receiver domain [Cocleimonas sp.]|jgi:hypothetical protein
MPELYREKIVSAFRDNAIKSVLLIDDHYLPYQGIGQSYISANKELSQLTVELPVDAPDTIEQLKQKLAQIRIIVGGSNSELMSSETAGQFVDFFHTKKLICDVENQTNNLDIDKIRKSDLIVLDYHLKATNEPNPAEHSLNLISELSSSKHMNVVVVFTAEELNDVWREIAATLRGTHIGNVDEFLNDGTLLAQWHDYSDDWEEEWKLFCNANIEAEYLKAELDITTTIKDFQDICEENGYEKPEGDHVQWLLEHSVTNSNKNLKPLSNADVHGKRSLWLQAGAVFIVLCGKERPSSEDGGARDTTPEEVWGQIERALVDWYPSFYRVITSELQNQIEDANLSMEKVLTKSSFEQIAALWGILRVHDDNRIQASKELLNTLLSDVVDKVKSSSELLNFVKDTANNVADDIPQYVNPKPDPNRYNLYLKTVMFAARKNYDRAALTADKEFCADVLHALNEQLSTVKELPNYISTGVILKDLDDSSYYLCIAPSCNTVPSQTTGMIAQRMTPHRPMRFIKLANKTDKLLKCLKDAHKSNTIFISDGDNRLALSVYEDSDNPTIEQGVVLNHDTDFIEEGKHKDVQFFTTNSQTRALEIITKRLKPIVRMRGSFASRYQNTQLQYESRIGVDLISAHFQ